MIWVAQAPGVLATSFLQSYPCCLTRARDSVERMKRRSAGVAKSTATVTQVRVLGFADTSNQPFCGVMSSPRLKERQSFRG